jgi:hypothetical protein
MKKMKRLFFSVTLLSTVFIFIGSVSAKDLQKIYTWKYNINKNAKVTFNNYDCNLTIHTWDKAETEYHLTVDAKTRNDEDAIVLDTYLTNMKFQGNASSVDYKDNFWETRNSLMGKMTMKLGNGKTISLTEFSIKGEVWIPSVCRFELESKYSDVHLEDFAGSLILVLYNDNFFGGSVKGNAEINDKYSTMVFGAMKDVKVDLYNSKLLAENMGNLKSESKYARVKTTTAGRLEISSYNDNYEFTNTGDIIFNAKYSDLKSEISGKVTLDCYEGSVSVKEAKDISITSKYADFTVGKSDNIAISSSYNDQFNFGKVISLKIIDSKYCSYKIEELANAVTESDGYEDKFTILKTSQDFKEFSINGKYTEVSLGLAKTTDYKFRAKIQYADLDINESQLKSKTKIVEGASVEYDAVKGTEKEGMPLVEIEGYQMGLKIVEL